MGSLLPLGDRAAPYPDWFMAPPRICNAEEDLNMYLKMLAIAHAVDKDNRKPQKTHRIVNERGSKYLFFLPFVLMRPSTYTVYGVVWLDLPYIFGC